MDLTKLTQTAQTFEDLYVDFVAFSTKHVAETGAPVVADGISRLFFPLLKNGHIDVKEYKALEAPFMELFLEWRHKLEGRGGSWRVLKAEGGFLEKVLQMRALAKFNAAALITHVARSLHENLFDIEPKTSDVWGCRVTLRMFFQLVLPRKLLCDLQEATFIQITKWLNDIDPVSLPRVAFILPFAKLVSIDLKKVNVSYNLIKYVSDRGIAHYEKRGLPDAMMPVWTFVSLVERHYSNRNNRAFNGMIMERVDGVVEWFCRANKMKMFCGSPNLAKIVRRYPKQILSRVFNYKWKDFWNYLRDVGIKDVKKMVQMIVILAPFFLYDETGADLMDIKRFKAIVGRMKEWRIFTEFKSFKVFAMNFDAVDVIVNFYRVNEDHINFLGWSNWELWSICPFARDFFLSQCFTFLNEVSESGDKQLICYIIYRFFASDLSYHDREFVPKMFTQKEQVHAAVSYLNNHGFDATYTQLLREEEINHSLILKKPDSRLLRSTCVYVCCHDPYCESEICGIFNNCVIDVKEKKLVSLGLPRMKLAASHSQYDVGEIFDLYEGQTVVFFKRGGVTFVVNPNRNSVFSPDSLWFRNPEWELKVDLLKEGISYVFLQSYVVKGNPFLVLLTAFDIESGQELSYPELIVLKFQLKTKLLDREFCSIDVCRKRKLEEEKMKKHKAWSVNLMKRGVVIKFPSGEYVKILNREELTNISCLKCVSPLQMWRKNFFGFEKDFIHLLGQISGPAVLECREMNSVVNREKHRTIQMLWELYLSKERKNVVEMEMDQMIKRLEKRNSLEVAIRKIKRELEEKKLQIKNDERVLGEKLKLLCQKFERKHVEDIMRDIMKKIELRITGEQRPYFQKKDFEFEKLEMDCFERKCELLRKKVQVEAILSKMSKLENDIQKLKVLRNRDVEMCSSLVKLVENTKENIQRGQFFDLLTSSHQKLQWIFKFIKPILKEFHDSSKHRGKENVDINIANPFPKYPSVSAKIFVRVVSFLTPKEICSFKKLSASIRFIIFDDFATNKSIGKARRETERIKQMQKEHAKHYAPQGNVQNNTEGRSYESPQKNSQREFTTPVHSSQRRQSAEFYTPNYSMARKEKTPRKNLKIKIDRSPLKMPFQSPHPQLRNQGNRNSENQRAAFQSPHPTKQRGGSFKKDSQRAPFQSPHPFDKPKVSKFVIPRTHNDRAPFQSPNPFPRKNESSIEPSEGGPVEFRPRTTPLPSKILNLGRKKKTVTNEKVKEVDLEVHLQQLESGMAPSDRYEEAGSLEGKDVKPEQKEDEIDANVPMEEVDESPKYDFEELSKKKALSFSEYFALMKMQKSQQPGGEDSDGDDSDDSFEPLLDYGYNL